MEFTVKQMKELLEKHEDDTVMIVSSDNPELQGNFVNIRVSESLAIRQIKIFRDMMDGISFPKEVYTYNSDGKKVLRIMGL